MSIFNCIIIFFLSIRILSIDDIIRCQLQNNGNTIQQDSIIFIKIRGDLYDPQIIWNNEKAYLEALNRMERHLFVKDNRLQWNIKKGSELKISENIFQYVVDAWKNQNKMVETGEFKIVQREGRYIVLSKERLEEEKAKQLTGKAPDFKLPDTKGNIVKLSDYKGKYLLVDFWASWCKPCREKAKELKKHYSRLKESGVEVVGISCDKNKDQWLKAIEEDQPLWVQVVIDKEINGSDTADDYKVEFIPTLYLISPEGMILEKNPSVEKIESIVIKL